MSDLNIMGLCRGKRVDNNEWVYGFYFCIHHNDDRNHLHHFIIPLNVPIPKDVSIGKIQIEVDPNTIDRYVGKNDKKNKMVFENDIVKVQPYSPRSDIEIRKVVFNKKTCGFEMWWNVVVGAYGEKATYKRNFADSKNYSIFEVVGNLHDNPKLLSN